MSVVSPTVVSQTSLVSSQTLSTFICVEASSVQISDVNIWAYKLTLKLSLVVDFALSQRLRVACTIAVIRKSINRYETGLTVVVFYLEALLFKGRSTTSETPDKNASILWWNINMVEKWRTLKVSMSQCPSLPISGSGSNSGSIARFGHRNFLMKFLKHTNIFIAYN